MKRGLDWCSVCSNAKAVLSAELWQILVILHSCHHLWPPTVASEKKNMMTEDIIKGKRSFLLKSSVM